MSAVLSVGLRKHRVEHLPALEAAKRLGHDVILIGPSAPRDRLPDLVTEAHRVDVHDDAAFDAAVDAAALAHEIRGVVTWSDDGVEPAARAAARLGLPGPSIAAARLARNKFAMRETLHSTVPHLVPRFARVRTWGEARRAAETTGFPAVLKPAAGSGSKGIFQVADLPALREAFAALSRLTGPGGDGIFRRDRGEMILEELLTGTEHSVEGFVHKGTVIIAGVTDKTTSEPFRLELAHRYPSALPQRSQDAVAALTREAVEGLGLDDCAFHLECMVDSGTGPRLIEVAARAGGDCIGSHLVTLATGASFHENVIRVSTGLPPRTAPPARHAGMRKIAALRPGVLAALEGLEVAAAVPGVVAAFPLRAEGAAVALPPVHYGSSLVAAIIAVGADPADVQRSLTEAEAAVTVRLEP